MTIIFLELLYILGIWPTVHRAALSLCEYLSHNQAFFCSHKFIVLILLALGQSKCWWLLAIFLNQGDPRILIFGFAAISLTLSVVLSSEARAFCIITDDDGFSNWGQPYIPWLLLPLPKYFGHALLIHAPALNTVGIQNYKARHRLFVCSLVWYEVLAVLHVSVADASS